jgi:hypothetical protein
VTRREYQYNRGNSIVVKLLWIILGWMDDGEQREDGMVDVEVLERKLRM